MLFSGHPFLGAEIQRVASVDVRASARLGRLAQSEIGFKFLVVKA